MNSATTDCKSRIYRRNALRGAALVEMAFMLPVLILMLVGMIEFGHYIMTRERINKTTNQLTSVLYNVSLDEVQDDRLLSAVLDQARIIARPLREPTIGLRFCDWQDGQLYRVYKKVVAGPATSACKAEGPQCGVEATKSGFGNFVQIYACSTYEPLILNQTFGVLFRNYAIESLSYLPLVGEAGVVKALELLPGGGRVPESANCMTNPEMCSQEKKLDCQGNTEEIGGQCRTKCDEGHDRDTSGQCSCPPGKSPDGNSGCSCAAGQEWVIDRCEAACEDTQERVGRDCKTACNSDEERIGTDCYPKCPNQCDYRSSTTLECTPKPNC